jgi:type II secretory pathway component PulJ
LLTLHWLLTGVSLLVAAAALVHARRVSKRLERLTESYWQLRYELGQLRARVTRLEPADVAASGPANAEQPAGATAFVPLSSLKR